MEQTYYITRRDRWSREDGPTIDEAEWNAYVDEDSELSRDGEATDDGATVRWLTFPGSFRFLDGNIVGETINHDGLAKMLTIAVQMDAKVMGHDGVVYVKAPSPTSMRRARRVIPRAAAALLLSVLGLAFLSCAMLHMFASRDYTEVSLRGASFSFVTPPLIGVGAVALIASAILAVSSLVPWDRRWSKYAMLALALDVVPVLVIAYMPLQN